MVRTWGKLSILCSPFLSWFCVRVIDGGVCRGDAYAVAQRFWEFSAIFASPVRLVIALVFLYQYGLLSSSAVDHILTLFIRILGWSALSGVAVILVAYVVNYPLAKYNISVGILSSGPMDFGLIQVSDYAVLVESQGSSNEHSQRAASKYSVP